MCYRYFRGFHNQRKREEPKTIFATSVVGKFVNAILTFASMIAVKSLMLDTDSFIDDNGHQILLVSLELDSDH